MSDKLVKDNINMVRAQIAQKIGKRPFYASSQTVTGNVTDVDTFPYPRYYRGIAGMSAPVIYEREAGWRQRHDACYNPVRKDQLITPVYCWQNACSTVLPCKKVRVAAQNTECVITSP